MLLPITSKRENLVLIMDMNIIVKFLVKYLKETIPEKTLFTSLFIQLREENFLHGKLKKCKVVINKKKLFLVFIHQTIVKLLLILTKNNIFFI